MLSANVTGDKELLEKLKKLSAGAVKEAVYDALREGTDIIAAEAKRRCPVDTGALRDSIVPRTFKDSLCGTVYCDYPNGVAKSKKTGKPRYYATAVEYGTRKTPAQPFLKPALRAKKKEVLALVLKMLNEAVAK